MALQLRRGLEANRKGNNDRYYAEGELIYITNSGKVFVGNGQAGTIGGNGIVAAFAGTGLTYDTVDNVLKLNNSNLGFTLDNIDEGSNASKKFFTAARAATAAKDMLVNGTHTGITFTWHSDTNTLDAVTSGGGGGMADLVSDASPQLGGNLDINTHNITGTGNIDITGTIKTSLGLGGNLLLNGNDITGSGSVSVTGSLAGSSLVVGSVAVAETAANRIKIGTTAPAEIIINGSSSGIPLSVQGITTGQGMAQPSIAIGAFRGSFTAPTIVQNGDNLGLIHFDGWTGSTWAIGSYIASRVIDSVITSGDGVIATELYLGSSSANTMAGEFTTIKQNGSIVTPSITTGSYAGSGAYPSPAAAGTIIFNSNDSHFYGYDGSTWKQLDN